MAQQSAGSVVVYADYVCPFCYLGYESLDRYREGREESLEADWHPFDLRGGQRRDDGTIDHSVDTGKDEAYYEEARANVRRLADRYDVDLAQEIARDVDSYDAQRVAWRVRDEHPDAFDAFHRGTFEALWVAGRDVGDEAVLEDVAADAGLPEGFVSDTLADEATGRRLERAFQDARERGITAVPTFVAGEHAARGAVPPEQLERLVEGT